MKTTRPTRLGVAIVVASLVAVVVLLLLHHGSLPLISHTGKTVDGSFFTHIPGAQ